MTRYHIQDKFNLLVGNSMKFCCLSYVLIRILDEFGNAMQTQTKLNTMVLCCQNRFLT